MIIKQPIADKVVIKPAENAELTQGGLIVPDVEKERYEFGTVIAVGPGRPLENGAYATVQCEKGDTVVYPKSAVATVEIDGVEYKVGRELDLILILTKE